MQVASVQPEAVPLVNGRPSAEHEIMVLPRTRQRGHLRPELRLAVLAQQPGCLGVQEHQPIPALDFALASSCNLPPSWRIGRATVSTLETEPSLCEDTFVPTTPRAFIVN